MAKVKEVLGRDVTIILARGNAVLGEFSAIKSFDVKFRQNIIEEQYLGQDAAVYREVYLGVDGNVKFNMDDDNTFNAYGALIKRSQGHDNFDVNVTFSVMFSNGQVRRCQLRNIAIGDLPFGVPNRDRYAEAGFDFKCSKGLFL